MKDRAPRNRTLVVSKRDATRLRDKLVRPTGPCAINDAINSTICHDALEAIRWLPAASIDLLFADPPYNLTKSFNGRTFSGRDVEQYERWLESWVAEIRRVLKPTASVYLCGDWRSAAALQRVAQRHFTLRNRITWEREKGRGAKSNWKNCSEDIWFCTVSDRYVFNVDAVKIRRRVVAPYTGASGEPKDWDDTQAGRFRSTHPSNLWTDLTVPFWSMPENTDHPTQKPEKLLAKIILASSNEGDVVLDPFVGSGTTSVVAKKLGRSYIGIEIDEEYCLWVERRLELADEDAAIQGYADGVFWDRNTLGERKRAKHARGASKAQHTLFPR